MGPFVVLAAALAFASVGVTLVAALHLHRRATRLSAAVTRATRRLTPLVEELQAEAAVANLELEALQRRAKQPHSAPEADAPGRGSHGR